MLKRDLKDNDFLLINIMWSNPYHVTPPKDVLGFKVHKKKKQGSRSMTWSKKEEKIHGDDVHSGITSTGYKVIVNKKVPKLMQKYVGFKVYEAYTYLQQRIVGGFQTASTICFLGTIPQTMISTASLNLGQNPDLTEDAYVGLNPDAGMVGAPALNSVPYIPDQKLCLRTVDLTLRVSNFSSIGAEVELIFFKCVNDTDFPPDQMWDRLVDTGGFGTTNMTQPSSGNWTGGNFGHPTKNAVGTSPLENRDFKKFWRPLKIHHINLAASAEEKIHYSVVQNQNLDLARFIGLNKSYTTDIATWTIANTTVKYPKGSTALMMVSRGALVKDVTEGGQPNLCTFGGVEIGYAITKITRFSPVKNPSKKTQPLFGQSYIPGTQGNKQSYINIVDQVMNVVSV